VQGGVFFPSAKDWEVSLRVVNVFFPFFSKIMDWEELLDTLGDTLSKLLIS
jgi:hypothetical protein